MMGVRTVKIDGKEQALGNFNGGVWQFIMRNRFPQEWKDRKEIETRDLGKDKFSSEAEAEVDRILRAANIDPETLKKKKDGEA